MNVLAFSPMYNSPGKSDDSGAFELEADAFVAPHVDRDHCQINNHLKHSVRGAMVLEYLDDCISDSRDAVAFFGHGVSNGMPSFGFDLRGGRRGLGVEELGKQLNRVLKPGAPILLYCCLTGKSNDGFACRLSHASGGRPVFAHSTAGHATSNPNKYKCVANTSYTSRASCIPAGMTAKRFREKLAASQQYRLSYWKALL